MTWHMIEAYEWMCDGCGDTDVHDVDDLPTGWTTEGDEHWCEDCS